jgi:RecB family endonuclease NucS
LSAGSEDDEGTSRHVVIRNEKNIPFISGLHTIVARSKDESLDLKFKSYSFQCKYIKDLEKHLEDFLVQNWTQTIWGKDYDIYQEEGEMVGQQFPTDTGPIDVLAVSKYKKTPLVVELKKGRASDNGKG